MRLQKLPSPQGVVNGQTSTISLPLGPTYERLDIHALREGGSSGPIGWQFANIKLIVDGRTQIELTGEELRSLNQYHGHSLVDNVLSLHLANPHARTMGGEDLGAYGTAVNADGSLSVQSMVLELELAGAANLSKLEVYYLQGDDRPYGPHTTIRRISKSFGSIGTAEISDIRKGNYNMLGMHVTSDAIDEIEVVADQTVQHISNPSLRSNQANISGRVQQTGWTSIDFVPKNRIAYMDATTGVFVAEAFPMAFQDFRVKLGFTAAPDAYSLLMHAIEGPVI
jgi:hypothetical protein